MLAQWQTDWTDIPREDRYARPVQWVQVEDRRAVRVHRGSIRKAAIRATVFLLSTEPRWLGLYRDHYRVTVQCLWFGRKPAGSWMHILALAGDYEVLEHYTGPVAVNLARHPTPENAAPIDLRVIGQNGDGSGGGGGPESGGPGSPPG
jgi:hypothetical protein